MVRAALAVAIVAAFGYGVAVGRLRLFPYGPLERLGDLFESEAPYGRWHESHRAPRREGRGGGEELASLGYAGAYAEASGAGAFLYDHDRVQRGLTLYCSGHAPVVSLIDLAGEVVHEWRVPYDEVWPGGAPYPTEAEHEQFVRRALPFPTGELLVVFEYIGLAKVDRDGQVLWSVAQRNHHDATILPDGTIVSLVHTEYDPEQVARDYPGLRLEGRVVLDEVVFLSAGGLELRRLSLLDAFCRSEYAHVLAGPRRGFDVFHANSVDVVPAELAAGTPFEAGDLLLSLRDLDAVVALDPDEERITWLLAGKWRRQHQAHLLENGNVLLLDNMGGNAGDPLAHDASRVVEFDPVTQRTVWQYRGTPSQPFHTSWLGYVQRLPNGNTLVTESTEGRIFEVAPEGDVVWEFLNPARRGELIATVMGARRIPIDALEFLHE